MSESLSDELSKVHSASIQPQQVVQGGRNRPSGTPTNVIDLVSSEKEYGPAQQDEGKGDVEDDVYGGWGFGGDGSVHASDSDRKLDLLHFVDLDEQEPTCHDDALAGSPVKQKKSRFLDSEPEDEVDPHYLVKVENENVEDNDVVPTVRVSSAPTTPKNSNLPQILGSPGYVGQQCPSCFEGSMRERDVTQSTFKKFNGKKILSCSRFPDCNCLYAPDSRTWRVYNVSCCADIILASPSRSRSATPKSSRKQQSPSISQSGQRSFSVPPVSHMASHVPTGFRGLPSCFQSTGYGKKKKLETHVACSMYDAADVDEREDLDLTRVQYFRCTFCDDAKAQLRWTFDPATRSMVASKPVVTGVHVGHNIEESAPVLKLTPDIRTAIMAGLKVHCNVFSLFQIVDHIIWQSGQALEAVRSKLNLDSTVNVTKKQVKQVVQSERDKKNSTTERLVRNPGTSTGLNSLLSTSVMSFS